MKLYYADLKRMDGDECASTAEKKRGHYDLSLLPGQGLRKEVEAFFRYHGRRVKTNTLYHENQSYRYFCESLRGRKEIPKSLLDLDEEVWVKFLSVYLIKQGKALIEKSFYENDRPLTRESRHIQWLRKLIHYTREQSNLNDIKPEQEKDFWHLDKLGIDLKRGADDHVKTFDFRKISQPVMREEAKKAIYYLLHLNKVKTVRYNLISLKQFSIYLKNEKPEMKSFAELNRAIIEDYLVYTSTEEPAGNGRIGKLWKIKRVLAVIGKLYEWNHLEHLFSRSDIPKVVLPEFDSYSDEEIRNLNKGIIKLQEQMARCMMIHQMLGTRISDTLTLRRDCLWNQDGVDMIRIYQEKTSLFQKPIDPMLATLIRKAIAYSEEYLGESIYIFPNDNDPSQPLSYGVLRKQFIALMNKEQMKDDDGEVFHFKSHKFRRTYGAKLVEAHADDWTIAKMLGHKSITAVIHYRRTNNQTIEEETRAFREMQTQLILENLKGWESDYEQIR